MSIYRHLAPLALSGLLVSSASAQGAQSPYQVERVVPVVVSTTGNTTVVQFGPVQLAFAGAWSFKARGNLSKGEGPASQQLIISVLRSTSQGDAAQALAQGMRAQGAISRVRGLVEGACAEGSQVSVAEVPLGPGRLAVAGSCEERSNGSASGYYLHYEVYSGQGVVQLFSSGSGPIAPARELLDQAAQSCAWLAET